jgi:formamidopyrimidine-DNA glycosylase
VQGWGALRLLDRKQLAAWKNSEGQGIDPASSDFTYDLFRQVVEEYSASCDKSVKAMLVNRPRIRGIGNGYLQDILHRAGLHPARKVREITAAQRRKLFQAIRSVLTEAIKKGGRDDEQDLFGNTGRYVRTMDRRSLGKSCPRCGEEITKMQYYGGTCYVCPGCQQSG